MLNKTFKLLWDNFKQWNKLKLNICKQKELEWYDDYQKLKIEKCYDAMHSYVIGKEMHSVKIKTHYGKKIKRINLCTVNDKPPPPHKRSQVASLEHKQNLKLQHIHQQIKHKRDWSTQKIKQMSLQITHAIAAVNDNNHETILGFKMAAMMRLAQQVKMTRKVVSTLNKNKLVIFIALIALFAGMMKPVFFTQQNLLTNVIKNNIEIGIMAVGMTFVVITGGIDLSVGSLLGLLGIFLSKLYLMDGHSFVVAMILSSLMAIAVGLFHGLLISKLKLPPFITTLVGLLAYRGLTKIIADSKTLVIENRPLTMLNTGTFLGIPALIYILIGTILIGMFILKFTKLGRNVYAVGGNEEAARFSGVKTYIVIMIAYVMSSVCVMLATISYAARIGSFAPSTGEAYELDVISMVVLGGTSLTGGKGGVGRTIIGWLVISTLSNAMNLLGYQDNWQWVIKGIIILIAVILDKNFVITSKIKKIFNKLR